MFGYRARKSVVITAIIAGGFVAIIGKFYLGNIGKYISIGAFVLNALILYIGKKL